MFTINLDSFKIQQEELHRQAARQRLVKSLEKPSRGLEKFYSAVGNALIVIGQYLLSRAQAAY